MVDSLVLENVDDLTAANTAMQQKLDVVMARVTSHKESAIIRTLEISERPDCPKNATALDTRVDAIRKMVLEPGTSTIALVGMGGIGELTQVVRKTIYVV